LIRGLVNIFVSCEWVSTKVTTCPLRTYLFGSV
jgi:hypothetical protein